VLSIRNNSPNWWGEGDDKFWIDGEEIPSLHGTGSEDYFLDAWGMREMMEPYYGCSISEGDIMEARCTVFRWHIEDPIPFTRSIKVAIEHGHGQQVNDREDDYYSVAFWYQTEPHKPFGEIPPVTERLISPSSPENLALGCADNYQKMREYSKAVEILNKLIEQHPQNATAYRILSEVYLLSPRAGDLNEYYD